MEERFLYKRLTRVRFTPRLPRVQVYLIRPSVYNLSVPYKDARRQREYQCKWMETRRKERVTGLKCARCNSTKNLQIDHVDPRKKVSHRIWSWSDKRFKKEMKKCQPLCSGCHKAKTREDFIKFITHCPKGHRYNLKNTHIRKCNSRQCRTCDKLAHRARRAVGIR